MWFFQHITQYDYALTHAKIPANSAGKWIIKISTSLNQNDNYLRFFWKAEMKQFSFIFKKIFDNLFLKYRTFLSKYQSNK